MDYLQILFFIGLGATTICGIYILVAKPTIGNPLLAAILSGAFAGFTAVQIYQEGVIMFLTNHSGNLTGIQVWWDLIMCVLLALFFILPRARKQNMNIVPWTLLVFGTASIGLLAMCARLFWLENAAEGDAMSSVSEGTPAKPSAA
jgi:glucan phosphoethanolaminetransferase (alkaline phosphatase superfamily)